MPCPTQPSFALTRPGPPCPCLHVMSEGCALHCSLHRRHLHWALNSCLTSSASSMVQRNGLTTDGLMVKALDGVSNLRWDIGVSSYPIYWTTLNQKDSATASYQLLSNLAVGVAGGSGISRANYIYDNVKLPEVSEHMSVCCLCGM